MYPSARYNVSITTLQMGGLFASLGTQPNPLSAIHYPPSTIDNPNCPQSTTHHQHSTTYQQLIDLTVGRQDTQQRASFPLATPSTAMCVVTVARTRRRPKETPTETSGPSRSPSQPSIDARWPAARRARVPPRGPDIADARRVPRRRRRRGVCPPIARPVTDDGPQAGAHRHDARPTTHNSRAGPPPPASEVSPASPPRRRPRRRGSSSAPAAHQRRESGARGTSPLTPIHHRGVKPVGSLRPNGGATSNCSPTFYGFLLESDKIEGEGPGGPNGRGTHPPTRPPPPGTPPPTTRLPRLI